MDLRQFLGSQGKAVGGRPHRKPPYFRTKKVGILGCTANIEFAPWTDPSWTLLSHCSARQFCRREPDWYFDLHRPECFERNKSWNAGYYAWLRALQTPIFMQEDDKAPWNKIPMAVRYPLERITQEFRPYFTNHAAYMVALAMTEGATHLGLWGCQYSNDSEYSVQRDSLTYWLGRFEQAGGVVVLPTKWNTLLAVPKALYGYGSHDAHGKLTAEYTSKKASSVSTAAAPATQEYLVDPITGTCAMPLMVDPEEAPDLDRAARLYGELVPC